MNGSTEMNAWQSGNGSHNGSSGGQNNPAGEQHQHQQPLQQRPNAWGNQGSFKFLIKTSEIVYLF